MSDGGAQPEERRLACATSVFYMFLTGNSGFLVCYAQKKKMIRITMVTSQIGSLSSDGCSQVKLSKA